MAEKNFSPRRSQMAQVLVLMGAGIVSTSALAATAADNAPGSLVENADPTDTATLPSAGATKPDAGKESNAEAGRAAPSRSRMIEEIIVTAQKREENLQKVPISIQAFSAEQLDAKGIDNPSNLPQITPGLTYTFLAGYTFIYLRGVGSDAFVPSADASVATYIDGVYYPFGFGVASALGNVERVEVLKGPQGTLFGRNSSGGAISITTRQPDPGGKLDVSVLASRESYDNTHLRAFINLPLNDTLAVSLGAIYYQADGFYKHTKDSQHAGPLSDEISQGYQAKVGWTPTDELKITLGHTWLNIQGAEAVLLPNKDPTPLGAALGVDVAPDYQTSEDAATFINFYSRATTADIKYQLPWFDTRFIGAIQNIGPAKQRPDYDGSSKPLVGFYSRDQISKVKTAEFQLISNDWNPDWLEAVAGVYYLESRAGYNRLDFNVAANVFNYILDPNGVANGLAAAFVNPILNLLTNSGVPDPIALINNLNNNNLNDNGIEIRLAGLLDTESTAGYFQGTAHLMDDLALTLGGRYQRETRTLAKSSIGYANPFDASKTLTLINRRQKTTKTSNFSPKAVLDYNFNDEQHAYLSFSQGFKSGTYNTINFVVDPEFVKPEKVTAYEIGYKATLLDGSMRFNTAIFQNNVKDLQVGVVSLTSGGVTRFETAGSVRIRGLDFDILWEVAPDTLPGLVMTMSGSYLDGKYTSYKDGSGFDDTTGLYYGGTGLLIGGGVTPGRDFTGNRTVRTPKFSGNFGPSYTFDLGAGQLELAADVYYNDGMYFTPANTDKAVQDAYYLLNARVSYLYEPWKTRMTVFGNNITSEKYYTQITQLDFGTTKRLAAPDVYGVKLQWDF